METTVQVRDRGVMTLPVDLRKKHDIQAGDSFRVVDLDGIFVLTPMVPMVPELAREIEKARLEAGLSVEELLEGLREQREQYYQETYESDQTR
jgi:bifunctional DNA-binding transcriptional regulator/antitoxin component of YhaV-PrlF toxin-antitoxin module